MHENDSIQMCTLLKYWNNLVAQKTLIAFSVDGQVMGPSGTISLKNNLPIMIDAVQLTPHSCFCKMKRFWFICEWILCRPYSSVLCSEKALEKWASYVQIKCYGKSLSTSMGIRIFWSKRVSYWQVGIKQLLNMGDFL